MKAESARERARHMRHEKQAQSNADVEVTVDDDNVFVMPARKESSDRVNVPPPASHKDKRPGNNRFTLGARWNEVRRRIDGGELTWEEFCDELDPEELVRGRLKDSRGGFTGRPPTWVPRAFFLACQRQLQERFNQKLQDRVLGAVEEYIELSRTVDDPAIRERMLRYIMERVMGPVPKEVTVSTEKPWEVLVTKIASRATPATEGSSPYAHRRRRSPQSGQS
jgi:hypothetical protein